FAVDVNPMAKIAYGLYKGKFLNAVSVGFIPLKWENGDGTSSRSGSPSPGGPQSAEWTSLTGQQTGGGVGNALGRGEGGISAHSTLGSHPSTRSAQFRRKYIEQELLEVSAVGIPANPNALALGLKAGAIEKSDLRDMADLIHQALDHRSAAGAIPSPGGPHIA